MSMKKSLKAIIGSASQIRSPKSADCRKMLAAKIPCDTGSGSNCKCSTRATRRTHFVSRTRRKNFLKNLAVVCLANCSLLQSRMNNKSETENNLYQLRVYRTHFTNPPDATMEVSAPSCEQATEHFKKMLEAEEHWDTKSELPKWGIAIVFRLEMESAIFPCKIDCG